MLLYHGQRGLFLLDTAATAHVSGRLDTEDVSPMMRNGRISRVHTFFHVRARTSKGDSPSGDQESDDQGGGT